MFSTTDHLIPVNRRLLVEVHKKEEPRTTAGVLLPEDFNRHAEKYVRVTILAAASNCHKSYLDHLNQDAIVEKSMIEDLEVGSRPMTMIQENYVLVLVKDQKEN